MWRRVVAHAEVPFGVQLGALLAISLLGQVLPVGEAGLVGGPQARETYEGQGKRHQTHAFEWRVGVSDVADYGRSFGTAQEVPHRHLRADLLRVIHNWAIDHVQDTSGVRDALARGIRVAVAWRVRRHDLPRGVDTRVDNGIHSVVHSDRPADPDHRNGDCNRDEGPTYDEVRPSALEPLVLQPDPSAAQGLPVVRPCRRLSRPGQSGRAEKSPTRRTGGWARPEGRRASTKTPGPAVHDDLVQRRFRASGLDEVWLTDLTEHPTAEGKLYCCSIKDCCSNRIVGYAIDDRMTAQLAVAALRSAIARRRPAGTVIVHSDRGGQFRARSFRAVLTGAGLRGSMGRVASAGDNAAMESFHALLQKNVLNQRRWRTRAELRYKIVNWIEHTYNRRRRQRALGKLTPVEYELALGRTDLAA